MTVPNHEPTPEENILANALITKGIKLKQQHFDGYKTVDIYIPEAKIDIEVDGMDHFMDSVQIIRDFKREYWSERAGYHTIHIPNQFVRRKDYLVNIINTIVEVVRIRKEELLRLRLFNLIKSE